MKMMLMLKRYGDGKFSKSNLGWGWDKARLTLRNTIDFEDWGASAGMTTNCNASIFAQGGADMRF